MKVAVVGGGFAGLAIAYFLLERGLEPDLLEEKEIGAGASGIASGLLHPYAGEQARRSDFATESIEEAKKLLRFASVFSKIPLADDSGILRKTDPKQAEALASHALRYGDVERLDEDTFLIRSGITVRSKLYLQSLCGALEEQGLKRGKRKVVSFADLAEYDLFFLAIGAGVLTFKGLEDLPVRGIKGQVLRCKSPSVGIFPSRTVIGKGYVVPLASGGFHLGATYERAFSDDRPDPAKARALLEPKYGKMVPDLGALEPEECFAGIRIAAAGHYFPIGKQISDRGWILTGMGSRGLLYHAYAAKLLVASALQDEIRSVI